MIAEEEIDEQRQLLRTYRRTLATYLRQRAAIGEAYSPPALLYGIAETRSHIQRIKSALRASGIEVPEDIDDDEPQPVVVAPRILRRGRSGLIVSVISAALLLTTGLALGLFGRRQDPTSVQASPQGAATAVVAITPGMLAPTGPISSVVAPQAPSTAPAGEQGWLDRLTTVYEIEPLLLQANIRLSAPDNEERTRGYFTGPESAYHMLAIASIKVVDEQRFKWPIYLDVVDKWYTQMSGSGYAKGGPLDLEKVKLALLAAHNDYYSDDANSLAALLEPRG